MTPAATQIVWLILVPVVGQLDGRVTRFRALADKGVGKLAVGIVRASQYLHA